MTRESDGTHGTSGKVRVVSSGCAGVLELAIFHPVDTVAKRMMNNPEKLRLGNISKVLFLDKSGNSGALTFDKFRSLYRGILSGAAYKVSQRIYKFGGQPIVRDYLTVTLANQGPSSSKSAARPVSKSRKALIDGLAGMIVGAGEVMLLPLDALKVMRQNNSELKNVSSAEIVKRTSITGLYSGIGVTAVRNIFGSFALFGVNSYLRAHGSTGGSRHSSGQGASSKPPGQSGFASILLGSVGGSVASIIVASPLDVVKTRIQSSIFSRASAKTESQNNARSGSLNGATAKPVATVSAQHSAPISIGSSKSALQIFGDILKSEGAPAFFKGLVPKLIMVGPKLTFSFAVAQWLEESLRYSI